MVKNFLSKRYTIRYPFKKTRMSKEWKGNKLYYDASMCISCAKCIINCPTKCLSFNKERKIVVEQERCISCGECGRVCPVNCIRPSNEFENVIKK